MGSKPYQDKKTLRELYINREMSQTSIAEKFDVSPATISKYLRRNSIPTRGGGAKVKYPDLHDEEWLREQYHGEGKSARDIAAEKGVDKSTVLDGLRECGISRRDTSTATSMGMDKGRSGFRTHPRGYEMASSRGSERAWGVGIHQLVAIANGADPHNIFSGVSGYHVHHKNEIPWDNRPENLEVMSNSKHRSYHMEKRHSE